MNVVKIIIIILILNKNIKLDTVVVVLYNFLINLLFVYRAKGLNIILFIARIQCKTTIN